MTQPLETVPQKPADVPTLAEPRMRWSFLSGYGVALADQVLGPQIRDFGSMTSARRLAVNTSVTG